jgi:hypothetical protein
MLCARYRVTDALTVAEAKFKGSTRTHRYRYGSRDRKPKRSIFGNRMGDDSSKNESDYRPKALENLDEGLQGWCQAYYCPVLLTGDAAKQLGWEGVDSSWQDHRFEDNTAEFAVLLPGYIMGQSSWDGVLSVLLLRGERIPLATYADVLIESRISPQGLLLHYPRMAPKGDGNLQLSLKYRPNVGFCATADVAANFVLAG